MVLQQSLTAKVRVPRIQGGCRVCDLRL